LNLGVYVFPGVVTVQPGIVCSNCKVQVQTWTRRLVGAVSQRRLWAHDSTLAPDRQQELAPAKNFEIPYLFMAK